MGLGGGLAGSLEDARGRGFIGRDPEMNAVASSLTTRSTPRVHFFYGPGGIGKSTLLDAIGRMSTTLGHRPAYVDSREIVCSTHAVADAIASQSGTAAGERTGEPAVLLIDGFELLETLGEWFRNTLLPSRPPDSVTVIAGRNPPPTRWLLDPGWDGLLAAHELGVLDAGESLELLARAGIAQERQRSLAAISRGHPLVLAMLAEAAPRNPRLSSLIDVPNLVSTLCALIVDDVPGTAQRVGLATCAHATRMTEDLLRCTVGNRAPEVWAWLASRPYVRRGAVGLFLHDVVRELFEAEFAHRSPDGYLGLHLTVREYFNRRLRDPGEPHPDRAAAEILLLPRRGPLAGPVAELRDSGVLTVARAGSEDHDGILELIANGEGTAHADLARRWFDLRTTGVYRVRSDAGVEGFSVHTYLPSGAGLDADDPVAVAILDAVQQHGPLRAGERIDVNRFAGATGHYQRDPNQLLANGVGCLLEWVRRPAAWTFITTIDEAYYGPYFEYLGMARLFSLPHPAGSLVGYGWDRRRFPLTALSDLMARRELSGETGPPPDDALLPLPLTRDAFAAEVRAALRNLTQPDLLRVSPLRRSAIIDPAEFDGTAGLAEVLLRAVAALCAEPRGAQYGRVLRRTYLKGAPSQERAAELLGLPFSTYRRHLAKAHERLVEILWSVELGERRLGPGPPTGGSNEQELGIE